MLLLVLILVLIAFGLLVVALLTGSVLWAWVSVAVSVAAAVVLLVDWLHRRSAVKAGADSGSLRAGQSSSVADVEPVTEILQVVPAAGQVQRGSMFDPVTASQETIVLPVVQPSGSSQQPSGASEPVAPLGLTESHGVTSDADNEPPVSAKPAAGPDGSESALATTAGAEDASGEKPGEPAEPSAANDEVDPAVGEDVSGAEVDPVVAEQPGEDHMVPTGAEEMSGAEADRAVAAEPAAGNNVVAEDVPSVEADPTVAVEPAGDGPVQTVAEDVSGDGTHPVVAAESSGDGVAPAAAEDEPDGAAPAVAEESAADGVAPVVADAVPEQPAVSTQAGPATNGLPHGGSEGPASRVDGPVMATTGTVAAGAVVAGAGAGSVVSDPPGTPAGAADASETPVGDDDAVPLAEPEDEPPMEPHDPDAAALVAELDDEVVVVDEQPRYHVAGCRSLLDTAVIPLPVSEAVELGFTPCGWCAPDRTLSARRELTDRAR